MRNSTSLATYGLAFIIAFCISYAVMWAIIWLAYNIVEWDGLFVYESSIPFFQWKIGAVASIFILVKLFFFPTKSES